MSSGRFSIVPAHAIDDTRLSASALRVLCALGTYGDKEGWCFPSMATISKRLDISRSAVQKQVRALQALGYLEVRTRMRSDGGQSSNEYRLVYDRQLPGLFDRDPLQPGEAGGQPNTVAPPATSRVAPPATSEVAPYNDGFNDPIEQKPARAKRASALPDDFKVSDRVRVWASSKGFAYALDAHLEYFLSYAKASGKRYTDWDEAFMNCIRADWGSVRKQFKPVAAAPATATCEFRGKQFNPAAEPCGMPNATASSFYGGRRLCPHHKHDIENPARSEMPPEVRARLGLKAKEQA